MELITDNGRLDVYDDFRWSLNYKTADVVNLTGRKASFSKTITIPYTKTNRSVLSGLDEWNVDNVGYDTKKSLGCLIQHNGMVLMTGRLVILKYTELKEEKKVEIQVISHVKTIISTLKKIKLNTLDFDRWNHEYTAGNVAGSTEYHSTHLEGIQSFLGYGKGYVYPIIDFGKDDSGGVTQWKTTDLRPTIYLKEYIDTIFRYAGKTYSSDFFDSPYFKSIVLLNSNLEIKLSQSELDTFDAEIKSNTTWDDNSLLYNYSPTPASQHGWTAPIYHNLEFNLEVSDPLDQWNITSSTNVFTAPRVGTFQFKIYLQYYDEWGWCFGQSSIQANVYATQPNGTYTFYNIPQIQQTFYLEMLKNGSHEDEAPLKSINPSSYTYTKTTGIPTVPGAELQWVDDSTGGVLKYVELTFETDLVTGDTITFRTDHPKQEDYPGPSTYLGGATLGGDNQHWRHRFKFEEIVVESKCVESAVAELDNMNFTNYVPEVDADKFLDSVFDTFNLWVLDNPLNKDDLIIEPRTNIFQGNSYKNMSKKLDHSKVIESNYLADTLPKVYNYKFAETDDTTNQGYIDKGEQYADYNSVVDVDFATEQQDISVEFAPLITTYQNGLYYPKEHKLENNVKSECSQSLKLGFVSYETGSWSIKDKFGNVTNLTQYTKITEFDSVTNPNYSLTFGDANTKLDLLTKPYWNLYKLFHELTEKENTRKGSKIITAFFNLNENDIKELDLRVPWFVNGVYYRIVEIADFNPLLNASTKVSLLQVEQPKFDFTSNEMIYKMAETSTQVLTTNKNQIVTTQKQDYVKSN